MKLMLSKFLIRTYRFLAGFSFCFAVLWIWIKTVHAYPDRDSIHQLFYPVMNYLKASTSIGNDLLYLQSVMQSDFPWGILVIPWMISACGLQNVFLENPWLLSAFLILPLVLTVWIIPEFESKRWLILPLIFFFPPVQLILKNLNLHSFVILYGLAGLFLMLNYQRTGNKISAIAGILSMIFACSVKHLGLILFLNIWIAHLLWLKRKRKSLPKSILVGLTIGIAAIQFYPQEAFLPYFQTLRSLNPMINPGILLVMGACTIFIMLFAWFQGVEEDFGRSPIERFLVSPQFLFLASIPIIAIFCMNPDFHGLGWMIASFVLGNACLIAFLRWKDFETQQGYLLLTFSMLTVTAFVFYFSRLGQVSAFFILPFIILLILVIQAMQSDRKLLLLASTFLIVSNFFPSLTTLESWLGDKGFRLYARGFNMIHQNPLGWNRSDVLKQREAMLNILKTIQFPETESGVLLGRFGIHHHYAVTLHFPKQFLLDVPSIKLPEDLSHEVLTNLYRRYFSNSQRFYKELLEHAEIPLILSAEGYFSDHEINLLPNPLPSENEISKSKILSSSMVKQWLHDPFFKFLLNQNLLFDFYDKYDLGGTTTSISLYVHKTLSKGPQSNKISRYLSKLIQNYQKIENPDLKVIEKLLLRAQNYLERSRILEAVVLLEKVAQVAPDNPKILNRLELARSQLRKWEKEILEKYAWQKLFKILVDQENLPWTKEQDWTLGRKSADVDVVLLQRKEEAQKFFKQGAAVFQTNPSEAIRLLELALKIDPNHLEAAEDLKILKTANSSEKETQKLFRQSAAIFESNPIEATRLLEQVLKMEPEHPEAIKDLEVLRKIQPPVEEISETNRKEAEALFKKSSEFFESNPAMAMQILTQVIALDPEHAAAKEDLQILKSIKPPEKDVPETHKQDAENLFKESSELFESNPAMAIQILTQVIALDPGHAAAKEDLAIAKLRLQKGWKGKQTPEKEKADALVLQASKIIESDPIQALNQLKQALEIDPQHKEAQTDIKKVKPRVQQLADSFFLKASPLIDSEPNKAIELLRQALKINPDHDEAKHDLKIAEEVIARKKASLLYHESLAYQQKQPRKALEILEQVLKLDPNHKVALKEKRNIESFLNGTSFRKARGRWFYSQAKNRAISDPVEANKLVQKALELDPGNEAAHALHQQLEKQIETKQQ